jgi:G protein-coupled receptor Mth (Methuselah protein)
LFIQGWNCINLTIALFIAQFSFLIGSLVNDYPLVCFTVAIMTHYGFLVAFLWMNVIAFDLYRNFSDRSSHILLSTVNLKRRLCKYALYAWMCPMVFVTICIILDFQLKIYFKKSIFKPCYASYLSDCSENLFINGAENHTTTSPTNLDKCELAATQPALDTNLFGTIRYCWIQNGDAALLFFGAPIGAIIIVNGILFLLTILNIRARRRRQKLRRTKSTDGSDVTFFMRIAVIMGFTWIIGFFLNIVSRKNHGSAIINEILNYLFVLCNTSTGLFIFILFILKQDVKKLYIDLIKTKIKAFRMTHDITPNSSRVLKAKTSAPTQIEPVFTIPRDSSGN